MKYEKPTVEVVEFGIFGFMTMSGGDDTPLGNYTCSGYKQGESCGQISWPGTGFTCTNFSSGNCGVVYAPPGSIGDGCNAWKLTCSIF